MSWNHTVRCGWCYKTGHNRNGCDARKEYARENPDSYEGRHEVERLTRSKIRRCSYCKETGHNRRKCGQMEKDKFILQEQLTGNRQEIVDTLKHRGLGIGSLVSFQRDYWNEDETYVGLIENITWNSADRLDSVRLMVMLDKGTRINRTFDLSEERMRVHDGLVVLSPVPEECISSVVPKTWLSGTEYDEEKYFAKGEERTYYLFGKEW